MTTIVQLNIQIPFSDNKWRTNGRLVSLTIDRRGKISKVVLSSLEDPTVTTVIVPCSITGNVPEMTISFSS